MMHSNRMLTVAIPFVIVGFFSYLARNYQLDDALIYLRYIKNFNSGLGLAYNPGEKFNGLTSPLFTYAILMISRIVANLQAITIILSAIFFLGAAYLGGKLFSKGNAEVLLTAGVIASFGYFYSTFGMETPLFLMLIGLSLYLYKLESRYFVIALALLVITRNEGIFLAAAMMADYLIRNRRLPDIRFLFIAILVFTIPFIFNYLYYGDFLPATGNAKIGQGQSGLWGEKWIFFDIRYFLESYFSGSYFSVVFLSGFALYGLVSLVREKVATAIIAIIFFLLLLGFYAGLNIPNYHWYYAPFFYFTLIFACRGFWQSAELLLSQDALCFRGVIFLAICTGALLAIGKVVSFSERGRIESYANIGIWLKNNTDTNASVAMVEIGTVGWYADRKIIDILGLVNPHNADYIGKREFNSWLQHYQPDYILRHDPVWPHEQSATLLESNGAYFPVSGFSFPGYALLKKSNNYSDQDIVHFIQAKSREQMTLDEMAKASTVGSPTVMKDGPLLFAHAPSSISLTTRNHYSSIKVSYGIKGEAEGKHSGVCFEIIQDSSKQKLMHSCIGASAKKNELSKHEVISFSGRPGEKLIFNTICSGSCDYAWSYWSAVELE